MAKKKVNGNDDKDWRKTRNPDSKRIRSASRQLNLKKVKFRSAWMSRGIIGAIALSLLAFFAITNFVQEKDLISQKNFEFLRNSSEYYDVSFKLKYPKDWQVNRYTPNEFSQIVAEFSPRDRYLSEEIKPKVFIEIRKLKKPLLLDEMKQAAASEINAFLPNSNIFEKKNIKLDSQPAYLLVYTGLEGENKLQKMQVGTIRDNSVYILTYEAKRDRYPEYQSTIQAMIDSFKFTKKRAG